MNTAVPAARSAVPEIGTVFAGVDALAVVVARGGQLPAGAAEAAAEAGGAALVLGSGAADAAAVLRGTLSGAAPTDAGEAAARLWFADTGPGLRVGALTLALAGPLAGVGLIVLPASPDGRDLAPRLAAALGRPLLAAATSVRRGSGGGVRAELARLESRLQITVDVDGPAVATLLPGTRAVPAPRRPGPEPVPVDLRLPSAAQAQAAGVLDVEVIDVLEPDPATMDLSEASRVLGGGAGLVAHESGGARDASARATFELLGSVAAALGASAGATRVVTDAGWLGHDRQIGTTGVAVDPDLYVAFGISGASQHTGGLGAPRHVVSINTDPASPMTAMADLGLVTDAGELLVELARRLGVPVPDVLGTAVKEQEASGGG